MPVDSGNNFNSKVSDVVVGFDILLEIIKDTLIATNKAGARAMNLGNYNLANKYIDHGLSLIHIFRGHKGYGIILCCYLVAPYVQ